MLDAPLPDPAAMTVEEAAALESLRRAVLDAASCLPATSPWRAFLLRVAGSLAQILGRRPLWA